MRGDRKEEWEGWPLKGNACTSCNVYRQPPDTHNYPLTSTPAPPHFYPPHKGRNTPLLLFTESPSSSLLFSIVLAWLGFNKHTKAKAKWKGTKQTARVSLWCYDLMLSIHDTSLQRVDITVGSKTTAMQRILIHTPACEIHLLLCQCSWQ